MPWKEVRPMDEKILFIADYLRLCNFFSVKVGRQIHREWGSGFHSQVNFSGHPVLIALGEEGGNKA
jgi:hypothetical protein